MIVQRIPGAAGQQISHDVRRCGAVLGREVQPEAHGGASQGRGEEDDLKRPRTVTKRLDVL